MHLIAKQDFTYAMVPLKVGDRFEASSAEDARLLKGFGKAEDARETDDTESGLPLMEANSPSRGKRQYRRRDMRAED